MIVVAVSGVRKQFGAEPVLNGVTFEVHPGERIGLVGPNGAGKTTLLQILAGREEADAGQCEYHPSIRWGYLEQQPEFQPGRTLWDEAFSAMDALVALQKEAEQVAEALSRAEDETEHKRLAARYDFLQHELQRHDAYHLDHKVERVLAGLGFRQAVWKQPVASLSGGEQNRVMLAKLLLADPDMMLLDEPSNHLDIEATEWLEAYLAQSSAAMLLVSHDRYFLDKVTTHTLELFRGTVDRYVGNFSAYWQQKADRLLVARRTYERQRQEIAKTEDFIRRNAYGQKHAQAEDRRKKLARIELVDPPREIAAPPMRFAEAERSGDIVVRVEGLGKSFDRPLFADVTFDILRGQRWGLLGANGTGKTTLLRCLLGLAEPDQGRIVLGQAVRVGYFDQQLAGMDDDTPVVDVIRPTHKELITQQRRDLLALFGLTGDTALQTVGRLSGGERCRAALARLAASDANVLVLDEPTNHLDLWARDALEQALNEFAGTVLFVSHDRFFVDRVADHLLVLEQGQVRVVEGTYRDYQRSLQESASAAPAASRSSASASQPSKSASNANRKTVSKRRFPYRKTADLEAEILQRESRLEEIHALLAQSETHRDGERVRLLKAEIDEQRQALAQLYEHWEESVELNG